MKTRKNEIIKLHVYGYDRWSISGLSKQAVDSR